MKGFYSWTAIVLVFSCASAFGQAGNFRTLSGGNWDNPGIWERDIDGDGIFEESPATASPTSASGEIYLNSGHIVTIPLGTTIDVDQLTLSRSSATTLTVNGTMNVVNGPDSDLEFEAERGLTALVQVNGTLVFQEGATASNVLGSSIRIKYGGTYQHNYTVSAGVIYSAIWETGSTLLISGYTTYEGIGPTGLNQNFSNVIWNCPNHIGFFIDLNGSLKNISDDFTIADTGNAILSMSDGTPYSLNVGGDLIVQEGGSVFFNYTSAATTNITVTGNFDWSSTAHSGLADGANLDMIVEGDFVVRSGAELYLVKGDYLTGVVNINLRGDLLLEVGSTVTRSTGGSVGATGFSFSGTSEDAQLFVNSGAISNEVDLTVTTASIVDFGIYAISGSGDFTLESGATMLVGSPDGLAKGVTAGNVRVSGLRTYASASNIVYNGSINQNLGDEWGTGALEGVDVNLEVNTIGSAIVVKNNNIGTTSVLGTLTLTQGILEIGTSNTLEISSNLSIVAGRIRGGTTSDLTISGSGTVNGQLVFETGTLRNFTISRAADVVLGSDLTVVSAIQLTSGNLDLSGHTLTMNGGAINGVAAGLKSTDPASNLVIGGSTFSGNVPFATGANLLNNLTFATTGSGSYIWNSPVTVLSTLYLNSGVLTHTSGITIGENATVEMNGGSFAPTPASDPLDATSYYNVVYQGTQTTGVELPSAGSALRNLTVVTGTITLGTSAVVTGNVTLQGGQLSAGSRNLTLSGAPGSWIKGSGSFLPGTGTVLITGNISIQGSNPQFGNLTVNAGATLSLPSSISINRNLQFDASATVSHNNGVVRFNGGNSQIVTAGGKRFHDISINKATGSVQLSSELQLLGGLSFETGTTLQSDGHLKLISTSDGGTGNAYIVALPLGATITGDIVAQRFMSSEGRIYRYISSPVSGASVADLQQFIPVTGGFPETSICSGCTSNPSMFYYDETAPGSDLEGYVPFPTSSNTETLEVGRGYSPFVRQNILPGPVTIDFVGPVNQGEVSLPVTYTNTGSDLDGYNLVGNPFPSTIDWDNAAGWVKVNVSSTMAIRDNGSGGGFQYWNGSTGGLTGGLIAAGQAFWVQTDGSDPQLLINEGAKTTTTGAFFRRRTQDVDVLEISVSNGKITDKAYFQILNQASDKLDKFDGKKLDNASYDVSILSKTGVRMAINATNRVPHKKESIRLHIKDMPVGNYTFSLNRLGLLAEYDYFLLDRYTKESIDLQETSLYNFSITSASASYASDRFEVFLFKAGQKRYLLSGVEDEEGGETIDVYPNPSSGRVYVKAGGAEVTNVTLLNSRGQIVEVAPAINVNNQHWEGFFDLTKMPQGVYLVRVIDVTGKISTFKVVKR